MQIALLAVMVHAAPLRVPAAIRIRGGERSERSEPTSILDPAGRIVTTRRGFYPQMLQALDAPGDNESNGTFCIQQVQGSGDCLFHSIAIGMAFEDEQRHLDMYDPVLTERVKDLRALAVKTLTDDPNRTLHLEGQQELITSELVEAAAEQYGVTADEYCRSMRQSGVWGGGPEILALANALERPIHVFEPVAACNGTEFRLQLCGAFGSPRFDASGKPVCIVAADDRFPNCKPTEVKRHGEGGNHFLALLPVACQTSGSGGGIDSSAIGGGSSGGGSGGGGNGGSSSTSSTSTSTRTST